MCSSTLRTAEVAGGARLCPLRTSGVRAFSQYGLVHKTWNCETFWSLSHDSGAEKIGKLQRCSVQMFRLGVAVHNMWFMRLIAQSECSVLIICTLTRRLLRKNMFVAWTFWMLPSCGSCCQELRIFVTPTKSASIALHASKKCCPSIETRDEADEEFLQEDVIDDLNKYVHLSSDASPLKLPFSAHKSSKLSYGKRKRAKIESVLVTKYAQP